MRFNFSWDPRKARLNFAKHGVTFVQAAGIFSDPNMLSIFDEGHSSGEDRWITLGISSTGALLVAHHTYEQVDGATVAIRIISSRKATIRERRQYSE